MYVVAVAGATLVPVVRREPERQQLLFRHGAARVVPEAVEELGLPHSKIPPPLGRTRERRGVVAEVASEAATATVPYLYPTYDEDLHCAEQIDRDR